MKMLCDVLPVTCHTKYVGPGSTFVAIKGYEQDGSKFIKHAIARGGQTVIIERCAQVCEHSTKICDQFSCDIVLQDGVRYEFVADAREELGMRSAAAWGHPSKRLVVVGVTGTKGKTTVTYLLRHMFEQAGYTTALAGTNNLQIGSVIFPSEQTTMNSDCLHAFLAYCLEQGVTHVFLEISSHALALKRTEGLILAGACLTNLGEDHLDFHGTMDNYFNDKCRIFDLLKSNGVAVVDHKDFWGLRAKEYVLAHTQAYLIDLMQLPGQQKLKTLPGKFNKKNSDFAYTLGQALGLAEHKILEALETFPGVPGRMQRHVTQNGVTVFVDYAHNAFSLKTALEALRGQTTHLMVVFGCGGGKDASRRASMGHVASEYADHIILTNDNPRLEDPHAIINDIQRGIALGSKAIVHVVLDRAQAIKHALSLSTAKTIVLIAGKGHEKTIESGNAIIAHDDYLYVSQY